jgi:hypothetical protein
VVPKLIEHSNPIDFSEEIMDSVELIELERLTSPVDGHLMIRMELRSKTGQELEIQTADGPIRCQTFRFTVREQR